MILIQCCNLSLGYEGHTVLHDLNLTIEQGDYLCVVGENGAGKSTLIKGILRLLKPQSGHIHFHLSADEVGYLPQQTPVQKDFPASVMEVVLSGFLGKKAFHPLYSRREKEIAAEKLAMLDATALTHRCYRDLSGGQQQRVLLARALCAAGSLLLMDEPFTGLDPAVSAELYAVIDQLNHKHGVTVLMVSHDLTGALEHAGKILHLGGSESFFGTVEEYRKTPLCTRLMGGDTNG